MTSVVLAVYCESCRHVAHTVISDPKLVPKYQGVRYKYCPLCGHEGTPYTSMNDVSDQINALRFGLSLEHYRIIFDMYMEEIRENDGTKQSFLEYFTYLLRSA